MVDQEELCQIYMFWQNNPKLWFNSTPMDDAMITEKYQPYLARYMNYTVDTNGDIPSDSNIAQIEKQIMSWTGYVILYDQLLKHINRHHNTKTPTLLPQNFIKQCYRVYLSLKDSPKMSDFAFMFMLMPLRHTHEYCHVTFVLSESWSRLQNCVDGTGSAIKKYIIATYERYIKLTPHRDKDNLLTFTADSYGYYNTDISMSPEIISILDTQCMEYYLPVYVKLALNGPYPLVDPLVTIFKNFIQKHNISLTAPITVSISGGVDSMVSAYILHLLGCNIVPLHINYMNRPECGLEEELLKYWCNGVLGVPLRIRRIAEINRPSCMEWEMRNTYESYTKQIRFNAYVNAFEAGEIPYIVLGHNQDDAVENILTNTATLGHYDNLHGMQAYSKQLYLDTEIHILRPLLTITKSDIYQFAKAANIPYLLDSTPKWSQRGKIRDIVRPALNEWNPQIIPGLLALSDKLRDMTSLLHQIIQPAEIITFASLDDIIINHTYWSLTFAKLGLHVTQNTIHDFLSRLLHLRANPVKLLYKQPIYFTLCIGKMLQIIKHDSGIQLHFVNSK